jgi:hypothetical protein
VTTIDIAAADGGAALLTLGIALYAATILICVGLFVHAMANHRRRLAIGTAASVIILSVAGVIIAIASSIG